MKTSPGGDAGAIQGTGLGNFGVGKFLRGVSVLVACVAFNDDGWASVAFTNYVTSGNPALPPGTNDVIVVPQGTYSAIDTKPITTVMLKLKNTVGHENDDLVQEIEQHSDLYAPPVFFALADLLYRQGKTDDAIFWFNAGRLRGDFDAARCADVSAREAISLLVMETPVDLRKAEFANETPIKSIVNHVIQWDEATPYHYEYRWINLHGLEAMRSGLQPGSAQGPLSLPESTWPDLAKKNREDYERGLNQAIAMIEQKKAEGIIPGATTNSVYAALAAATATSGTGPCLRFKQTINLGGVGLGFRIWYLAFSPDGHYLAILGSSDFMHCVLVVWDMVGNREQSRVNDIGGAFGRDMRNLIVWAQDDSYVTLAFGRRKVPADRNSPSQITLWNPLTGEKIREVEVSGGYGSLSPDGTHLAMVTEAPGHLVLRVYDTRSWASQDYSLDGLRMVLGSVCWTAKGKVVAIGSWDWRFPVAGLYALKKGDVLAREIDPSGNLAPRNVLLAPSRPAPLPSTQFVSSLTPLRKALDVVVNEIAVGLGSIQVFSGDSLQTIFTYNPPNPAEGAYGEIAFSPDGKYLYIMDARTVGKGLGVILDAQSGRNVGSFPSGTAGFSVSPEGRWVALGDGGAVKIFVPSE